MSLLESHSRPHASSAGVTIGIYTPLLKHTRSNASSSGRAGSFLVDVSAVPWTLRFPSSAARWDPADRASTATHRQ